MGREQLKGRTSYDESEVALLTVLTWLFVCAAWLYLIVAASRANTDCNEYECWETLSVIGLFLDPFPLLLIGLAVVIHGELLFFERRRTT